MAGHFELVTDHDGNCLVRLVDGRGEEIAVSVPQETLKSPTPQRAPGLSLT